MALGIPGSYEGYAFSAAAATGQMAAGLAAAAEIYQFRWAPGAGVRKCRILNVQVSASAGATGFTAGSALFEMVKATTWSVAGTGGATSTPTTTSNRLRTAQLPSQFNAAGEIRVATTAALTAGTKTLDAVPVGNLVGGAGAAGIPIVYPIPIYVDWASYGLPLVLDNQEGFIIRATVPAVGTWQAGVWVQWVEVD